MEKNLKKIAKLERSTRVALSKRYPVLLPIILGTKRMVRSLRYTLNPRYHLQRSDRAVWFNLTTHSSPLYRKYNSRELDERKVENIKIAIRNIDGLVIAPGKIFSFWKFVGKPTAKRGFKQGLVISDGQLKEDIGGGLCQLSNLIAYMFACTECRFIERKHHSRDVFPDSGRVVPFGSGATVFFNLIDLKVKNTYPFPMKINLHVTDTQLRGSISSTNQLDHVVKLEEKYSQFIRSAATNKLYRCNGLSRVFYAKNSKEKIKELPLWTNTAQVMYDEGTIQAPITTFDPKLPLSKQTEILENKIRV